ncbi:MAG: response regulator transcription factor [Hyphomicrobium sp.]|nr:response regulator transcription factor [Hyphomicrobium sp.]
MASKPIRLAIVDDHPMIRRGVRLTVGDDPDFEVVGEGATAEEAIAIAGSARPDAMLIDVSLPGDGVEAARAITKKFPAIHVAMMTIHDDIATVRRSLKAGVSGYITKGSDIGEIVDCVRRILRGERYVSPSLAVRLLEDGPAPTDANSEMPAIAASLSMREHQLLDLLGEGLSNADIASRTGLAETTVKQYVSALIRKLGVRNRTAAALMARSGH